MNYTLKEWWSRGDDNLKGHSGELFWENAVVQGSKGCFSWVQLSLVMCERLAHGIGCEGTKQSWREAEASHPVVMMESFQRSQEVICKGSA